MCLQTEILFTSIFLANKKMSKIGSGSMVTHGMENIVIKWSLKNYIQIKDMTQETFSGPNRDEDDSLKKHSDRKTT